jgi:hypothetical protein
MEWQLEIEVDPRVDLSHLPDARRPPEKRRRHRPAVAEIVGPIRQVLALDEELHAIAATALIRRPDGPLTVAMPESAVFSTAAEGARVAGSAPVTVIVAPTMMALLGSTTVTRSVAVEAGWPKALDAQAAATPE